MSPELLVALFGGTGIATVLGILYQIWKERHGNKQKDIAGDLTLGEMFRAAAKREVQDAYAQLDAFRARLVTAEEKLAEYKTALDEEVRARRMLESKYRGAQDYVAVLIAAWREVMGNYPLPEPPEEYWPDSRKFKPGGAT